MARLQGRSLPLFFSGSDEIDHLAIVPSIHAEVSAIDGQHLGSGMQLGHDDDRRVGQIHLLVSRHQRSNARPVRREIELQPNCFAFEQLEQGIDRETILAQKVYNFSEYRFANEHGSLHLLHKHDGPRVIRIVTIEIGKERTRVTDCDHGRLNLLRAFVAGRRLPAKLPARSALIA